MEPKKNLISIIAGLIAFLSIGIKYLVGYPITPLDATVFVISALLILATIALNHYSDMIKKRNKKD